MDTPRSMLIAMASQAFTRNYTDHSNELGFQFEFCCDKCGSGYRSEFQTNKLGLAAQLIKAAGSVLGGSVARAGWGADQLKDAFRGPAWDAAFKQAIDECKPKLRQCSKCGLWVCPEVCWNHARGLCEQCAPDLGEHAAAAQAQVATEQAQEQTRAADQLRGFELKQPLAAPATCGQCQAALAPNARFCAACGHAVSARPAAASFCSGCGTQLQAGARFCPQCGAAVS